MNICLYGASSPALDRAYFDAAEEFGRLLAQHGHTLVYGGGAQGVMGAAARGAADADGKITGIAPNFLNVDGILFDRCTEFILTDTMAERKAAMISRADAFVMAPGGFGTLEEFFEVLTLKQLGRHNPAIAILNTNGFWTPRPGAGSICCRIFTAKARRSCIFCALTQSAKRSTVCLSIAAV